MINTSSGKYRNYYISFFKLIASFFVVFLHVIFPGTFGDAVQCLARFAVPLFFLISGYYAYKAGSSRILIRLKKQASLLIISCVIYFLWNIVNCLFIRHEGLRDYLLFVFSIRQIALFLLIDLNQFGFHLWFLSVMIKLYAVLYLYLLFKNDQFQYKPLYYAAAPAFIIYYIMGLGFNSIGLDPDFYLIRNVLLLGFPLFTLGLFLHNYEDILIKRLSLNCKKLAVLFICGIILSFVEYFGIHPAEMPLGSMISAVSLLLLAEELFRAKSSFLDKLSFCAMDMEKMSLIIYIIHPLINYIITALNLFEGISYRKMIIPPLVLLISFLISLLYCLVIRFLSCLHNKK